MRRLTFVALLLLAAPARGQEWSPWRLIGPFDNPGGGASVDEEHSPEKELGRMRHGGPGPSGKKHKAFKRERIEWIPLQGAQAGDTRLDVGLIDFRTAVQPTKRMKRWEAKTAVYLHRSCTVAEDVALPVRMGSDDGLRFWLNGELIVDKGEARGMKLDDHHVDLELEAGTNHVLVKVSQEGGAWSFRMQERPEEVELTDTEFDDAVNAAIRRGVDWILARQLVDGSWGQWPEWGNGHAAFTAYTLLKCGLAPEHPAIRRAVEHMRGDRGNTTYSVGSEILALSALGPAADRAWLEQAVEELLSWQESNGTYGYPLHPDGAPRDHDLSTTLFAALALRGASQVGVEVPDEVWRELAEGTLRFRARNGGFSYREHGKITTSMTSAAISVFEIALERAPQAIPKPLRRKIDEAREGGLEWIAQNHEWGVNTGDGAGHQYYSIYGMERLGSLLGTEELGGRPWYAEGAQWLVQRQEADGSWYKQNPAMDTQLALLFLRRASKPTSGKTSNPLAKRYRSTGEDAEVVLQASGDTPLTLWIADFPARVREELTWPGDEGLRIRRVRFLAREAEGESPREFASVEPEAIAARVATRHDFGSNAVRWIHAAVEVTAPDGSERVLTSPEIEVRIDEYLDPALLGFARDRERNLLRGVDLVATASTENGVEVAARAFDGREATRWFCAPADPTPWIRLELPRGVHADRVLLTHAEPMSLRRASARPTEVDVIVNGGDPARVAVDPDPLAKTILTLPKPMKVTSLEVRLLAWQGRTLGTHAIGFSEIELQRGERE